MQGDVNIRDWQKGGAMNPPMPADDFWAEVKRCAADGYALELMGRRARGDVPSDDWFIYDATTAAAIANAARLESR